MFVFTLERERLEIFEETAEENSYEARENAAAIIANAVRKDALFLESEPVSRKLRLNFLMRLLNNNYEK